MIKIALTGKARSGKDYLAASLRDHGIDLYRLAFGDKLKRHCEMIFPDQFEGNAKPRQTIQRFGQMMREIDPDVWVRPVIETVERFENLRGFSTVADGFVVTDLRQPNEYAALREAGFTIIRVTASDETRIARMQAAGDAYAPEDLTHETESYIDGFAVDYEIRTDIDGHDAVAELRDFIGGM